MKNIVIVAGGLGTRFKDLSVFPKILLPTKKYNSLLEQDYEVLSNGYGVNLYLIINEKYYDMTVNYCQVNNINIHIIKSSNTNGSYNTILSVYDRIPHNNVLFIWSDLELSSNDFINVDEDTVFTYNGNYRFGIENNKISHHENYDGNILGIYFISNLDKYFTKHKLNEIDNFDFVEVLQEFDYINSKNIESYIEEYKDKQTYIDCIKYKDNGKFPSLDFKTRFFNMIDVDYSDHDNPKIKKYAINKDYYHIIQKEYNWYKNLKKQNLGNGYTYDMIVPEIYDGMIKDNTGFEMKFLDGYIPLHKYIKNNIQNDKLIQEIYQTIYNHLNAFSNCKKEVDIENFKTDLQKEVITKVLDRCDKIQYMLINYDKVELSNLLVKVYNYLLTQVNNDKVEYCVCHGDLNGSNVLVNPITKDVKFLDPRGYFGNTVFYGWQDYEFAKLLYCLDGYDDFNNLPQIYGIDQPIRLKYFDKIDYLNKKKYKILIGIIWVALAGYISQDIMKANIAYEYGLKLLKEYIK